MSTLVFANARVFDGHSPDCAEGMMRRGDNPAGLLHCR